MPSETENNQELHHSFRWKRLFASIRSLLESPINAVHRRLRVEEHHDVSPVEHTSSVGVEKLNQFLRNPDLIDAEKFPNKDEQIIICANIKLLYHELIERLNDSNATGVSLSKTADSSIQPLRRQILQFRKEAELPDLPLHQYSLDILYDAFSGQIIQNKIEHSRQKELIVATLAYFVCSRTITDTQGKRQIDWGVEPFFNLESPELVDASIHIPGEIRSDQPTYLETPEEMIANMVTAENDEDLSQVRGSQIFDETCRVFNHLFGLNLTSLLFSQAERKRNKSQKMSNGGDQS